jgi:hypothetical protein
MVSTIKQNIADWFDVAGIQRAKVVDSRVRNTIMGQFDHAIRLIAPGDVVQMGLALSSVPGVDMSGDSGQVLQDMQKTNAKLNEQVGHQGQILADFQKENREERTKFKTLEAEFRDYKLAYPPPPTP